MKRWLGGLGLVAAVALGGLLAAWSEGYADLATRQREILEKMPGDPDILINVEPDEVPGTPDLTRLGRAASPALRGGLLGNVNDGTRQRCADVLAILRDPASQPDLVAALRDRADGVRAAALHGLGLLVSTEPVPAVLTLLHNPDEPTYMKEAALRTLGRLGDPRALDDLRELVTEGDDPYGLRTAAVAALWEMRNTVPRGTLEDTLRTALAKGTSDDVVRWLGQMKSEGAVDDLMAHFPGGDRSVKNRILVALGDIGDDDAADFLVRFVRETQDGRLLNNASIALGKMGGRARAVTELVRLMADPKAYIRINAAFALGELGDPKGVDALVTALGDKNDYVRSEAAVALGRIGDARALPGLEKAASEWNPFVRLDATIALNRIDFAKYRPLLEKLLTEKAERIRLRAIRFLAEKRDPAVATALIELLRTASGDLQVEAMRALVLMPDVDEDVLAPALLYQLVQNWNDTVKRAALLAIREHQMTGAAGMLVELVHHSGGDPLRRTLFTLGQLKAPELLARLPQLAAFAERHDRLYLAYARAKHGDATAVETLLDGLEQGAVPEKRDAAFLLRHLDDASVVDRMRALLGHADPLVALGAAHGLVARDGDAMLGRLYEALGAKAPLVADEAVRTLRMVEGDAVDAYLARRAKGEDRWYVRQRVAEILYDREDKSFR